MLGGSQLFDVIELPLHGKVDIERSSGLNPMRIHQSVPSLEHETLHQHVIRRNGDDGTPLYEISQFQSVHFAMPLSRNRLGSITVSSGH